jgi:LPXTG-motif cell wall-anchored protein
MKTTIPLCLSSAIAALLLSGASFAQDTFPDARTRVASCDDFQWSSEMIQQHPRIVNGCQEVVVAPDGEAWARLSANFLMVHSDGRVVFEVIDERDRLVEQVALTPRPGQVASIDGRPTPFDRLRKSDRINLYAPENAYGFGTEPGTARENLVIASALDFEAPLEPVPAPLQEPVQQPMQVAMRDDPPQRMLPQTASDLPLLMIAGLLSMLGALGLLLRRGV